ncbi:hypothetical protein E05_51900 (plasmid) [Plautia stali symbiont]|nr:hypothetical protein E05_51900 [Plautia stali symbiont]
MSYSTVHCKKILAVSQLRKNPLEVIAAAGGEPVAVLSYNEPAFYCVPPALFEQMLRAFEARNSKESQ